LKRLSFSIILILLIIASSDAPQAKVSGECSNCHTMHNSQAGASMATYGGFGDAPFSSLVRGNCLGCHGQDPSGSEYVTLGQKIPQVYHTTGETDLAAGNFKHIITDDAYGHNVDLLTGYAEDILTEPPGDENDTGITTDLTCAGTKGCHGDRATLGNFDSIKGAHHAGVSGLCNIADTVANSYRFLLGVKGHENMDATYPWQNRTAIIHNEYYGVSSRGSEGGISSPGSNSISGLCAECHGNFHGPGTDDITIGSASPWLRHPTDIVLTSDGEYASYTTYSTTAPVARSTVYATINTSTTNDVVAPGTDIIMCLSCHGAHATGNYKLMRWDNKANMSGCVVCHTSKS